MRKIPECGTHCVTVTEKVQQVQKVQGLIKGRLGCRLMRGQFSSVMTAERSCAWIWWFLNLLIFAPCPGKLVGGWFLPPM